MKLTQIVKAVKSAGYSEIATAGGWRNLDDWTPYGTREHTSINFIWYGDDRIREIPLESSITGFVTGVWTLR
jgi:hypothetical protein